MFGFKRLLRMLAPLAVVCGALFAASCGSNSTPSATATIAPTQGYSVTLTTANGPITLPAVTNGVYATLNYAGSAAALPSPFPASGITLVTTSSLTAPTNAPVPTSAKRTPLSRTNATVALYLTFNVANALPASIFSGESLTLGSALPTNVPYFVELDDLTTGTYINTYPGSTVSNNTISFANSNGYVPTTNLANITLNTTDTYLFQFYYLGVGASPTPSPSPAGSASPAATSTPIAVTTTVPFGTADTIDLPVTTGGFVGTVTLPAVGTSATSLTTTALAQLPAGFSSVGTYTYPFYSLEFAATGSVTASSPAIALQLPTNFSTTNEIFATLCTTAASCPGEVQTPALTTNAAGGSVLTLNAGQFSTFTGFGTTPQYVIFYVNRLTPSSNSTSAPVPAGSVVSVNVPSITTSLGSGSLSSTVTLGGLSGATTATVAAQNGLFTGITAIIPNTQFVYYALDITASPAVTTSGTLACGSGPCVALTLPSAITAAATGKSFYVEQCSAAACPAPSTAPASLVLNGSTLDVSSAQVGSVAGLGSTPLYLVFYYQ